jgi:hypothetical protein
MREMSKLNRIIALVAIGAGLSTAGAAAQPADAANSRIVGAWSVETTITQAPPFIPPGYQFPGFMTVQLGGT